MKEYTQQKKKRDGRSQGTDGVLILMTVIVSLVLSLPLTTAFVTPSTITPPSSSSSSYSYSFRSLQEERGMPVASVSTSAVGSRGTALYFGGFEMGFGSDWSGSKTKTKKMNTNHTPSSSSPPSNASTSSSSSSLSTLPTQQVENKETPRGPPQYDEPIAVLCLKMAGILIIKTAKDVVNYPPMLLDEYSRWQQTKNAENDGELPKTDPFILLAKFLGVLTFKSMHDVVYYPAIWTRDALLQLQTDYYNYKNRNKFYY